MTTSVVAGDPAAWARRDMAKPGGMEKFANLLLAFERLVVRHGWEYCPLCDAWWPPEGLCEHRRALVSE